MAIILPSGFIITNNEPADSRFSVADATVRLSLSVNNVYEGLTVFQRDTKIYYILTNASDPSNAESWQIVPSSPSGVSTYIANGNVIAATAQTGSIFLVNSGSFYPFKISDTGATEISGSAENLFLIRNGAGVNVLAVSQSGVIIFATQSAELEGTAPVGGMYFTSSSFFVGLE